MRLGIFAVSIVTLLTAAPATHAQEREARTRIRVKGIVCSFCARGIEKKLEALPEVESVEIDMRTGVVSVHERAGQTVADETLRKLVAEAGYEMDRIDRDK